MLGGFCVKMRIRCDHHLLVSRKNKDRTAEEREMRSLFGDANAMLDDLSGGISARDKLGEGVCKKRNVVGLTVLRPLHIRPEKGTCDE